MLWGLVNLDSAHEVTTNLCRVNLGLDNLSCAPNEVGGVSCFDRGDLCNNFTLCAGEDEENEDSFIRLQCQLHVS